MSIEYNDIFDNKRKIEVFNKIAENYFVKNFGNMSKINFETLLFSEYIEAVIENKKEYDDYTLSKSLGITQNRIRTLKERKELQYPYKDFKWEDVLSKYIENAKYDDKDKYIKMLIEDVNEMNEIRNYIEKNGWFHEASLNKKLLKIRIDCFIVLFVKQEEISEKFTREAIENINKLKYKEDAINVLLKDFSRKNLLDFLTNGSKEAIVQVLKVLPVKEPIKTIFRNIANVIQKE